MAFKTPAAATLVLLLASASAMATEVTLRTDPSAPEAGVLGALYGDFVTSNPDVVMETALIDLDGDRVGEIAVRFRHETTCGEGGCHTAVLRHGAEGWRVVFERRTERIATGGISPGRGGANMAEIVVNDGEIWRWDGRGTYHPVLESVGTVVVPDRAADRDVADAAMRAFEESLSGPLAETSGLGQGIGLLAAEIDVGAAAGTAWLVSAEAPALCGGVLGCPQAVLVPGEGGLEAALVTYGIGAVAVLPSSSGGMRDIAFADNDGYRTMRWDGSAYRVAATSYPSSVTPAP